MCAAVSVVGLGVYLATGRPDLPGAAHEARLDALVARDPSTYTGDEWLAVMARDAGADPQDPMPHFASGQILLAQNRPQEAARAFDAALRRRPEFAGALMGLALSLSAIEGSRTPPEALALFEQAAALTDDPAPLIYQGIAAVEQGRANDARSHFDEALSRMSADDPRRAVVSEMRREAGR